MNATSSPVAAVIPRLRAAATPALAWAIGLTFPGRLRRKRSMIAGVASDDPSSTTTNSQSGKVCPRTDSIVAARYRSRLNAGRTTDTAGPDMVAWPLSGSPGRTGPGRRQTPPAPGGPLSCAPPGPADHGPGSGTTGDGA